MGGGGNAWMKIMGIDQDKVKTRHIQQEKEARLIKEHLDGTPGGTAADGNKDDVAAAVAR